MPPVLLRKISYKRSISIILYALRRVLLFAYTTPPSPLFISYSHRSIYKHRSRRSEEKKKNLCTSGFGWSITDCRNRATLDRTQKTENNSYTYTMLHRSGPFLVFAGEIDNDTYFRITNQTCRQYHAFCKRSFSRLIGGKPLYCTISPSPFQCAKTHAAGNTYSCTCMRSVDQTRCTTICQSCSKHETWPTHPTLRRVRTARTISA